MVVILSIPSSRFRRTPMFSVYPSICLASSGYNSLYSFLFSGYGIQKLSFQGVQVVSYRRGLLEIPLKAKLPIFSNCQVFFAYLNEITDKPEVLILSLAAVMQSSYFGYYHLTAGKKRLWAAQWAPLSGSAPWSEATIISCSDANSRENTLPSTRRRKVSFSAESWR